MNPKKRLGVLVSGSGSNLQALIDACRAEDFPAEIAVVLSNVPTAFALERARKAGIAAEALDHKTFGHRAEFERQLIERLKAHGVEIVCLAGFMRLLGGDFLRAFPAGVLNIHPSLLPAFPGLHGPRQAVQYGAKIAGCTVHFVDEGLDSGPVIVTTSRWSCTGSVSRTAIASASSGRYVRLMRPSPPGPVIRPSPSNHEAISSAYMPFRTAVCEMPDSASIASVAPCERACTNVAFGLAPTKER